MFGTDVMVDFMTEEGQTSKNLTFPDEVDWVSLNGFEILKAGSTKLVQYDKFYGLGLYQKAGTIVP